MNILQAWKSNCLRFATMNCSTQARDIWNFKHAHEILLLPSMNHLIFFFLQLATRACFCYPVSFWLLPPSMTVLPVDFLSKKLGGLSQVNQNQMDKEKSTENSVCLSVYEPALFLWIHLHNWASLGQFCPCLELWEPKKFQRQGQLKNADSNYNHIMAWPVGPSLLARHAEAIVIIAIVCAIILILWEIAIHSVKVSGDCTVWVLLVALWVECCRGKFEKMRFTANAGCREVDMALGCARLLPASMIWR